MTRATRCDCGKDATYVTIWQTPFMRAPSFWYDCEACLAKTVRVLKQHPQLVVETRKMQVGAQRPGEAAP